MQDSKSSNPSSSSTPAFKTPQPAELQREESRTSVQGQLMQEQEHHQPSVDGVVDENDTLHKEDSEQEIYTPEDIDLANLQIGIANRLAD